MHASLTDNVAHCWGRRMRSTLLPLLTLAAGVTASRFERRLLHRGGGGKEIPAHYFTSDAQDRSEMPPYQEGGESTCHPRCEWTCGAQPECNAVCKPACAPPQCMTSCTQDSSQCQIKCEPPKCAVVCPTGGCANQDCPGCQTVCGPPTCETKCNDGCSTRCNKPRCVWNCAKNENCPKPECKLNCKEKSVVCKPKAPAANQLSLPAMPGQVVVADGLAALDPTILASGPAAAGLIPGHVLPGYQVPDPIDLRLPSKRSQAYPPLAAHTTQKPSGNQPTVAPPARVELKVQNPPSHPEQVISGERPLVDTPGARDSVQKPPYPPQPQFLLGAGRLANLAPGRTMESLTERFAAEDRRAAAEAPESLGEWVGSVFR